MLNETNKKKTNRNDKKKTNRNRLKNTQKGKSYKNVLKSDITIKKLDINYSSDSYNVYNIPDFWLQVFEDEDRFNLLKQRLRDMMLYDVYNNVLHNQFTSEWKRNKELDLCDINRKIYHNYYYPKQNKPYQLFNTLKMDTNTDFIHYNTILCTCFIIIGVIGYKLKDFGIDLMIKGGKALQLASSQIKRSTYISQDIDLLVVDKQKLYTLDEKQKIAYHIGKFISWILDNKDNKLSISVKEPDIHNPSIYKLSYIKSQKIIDYRTGEPRNEYKAFCDIDFKDIPREINEYFENNHIDEFYISELNIPVLYQYPDINNILKEKLYYTYQYLLSIRTEKDRRLINEYQRIIDKFQKQIQYIIKILSINKKSMIKILNSLKFIDNNNQLIDLLYK